MTAAGMERAPQRRIGNPGDDTAGLQEPTIHGTRDAGQTKVLWEIC